MPDIIIFLNSKDCFMSIRITSLFNTEFFEDSLSFFLRDCWLIRNVVKIIVGYA